MSYYLKSGYPDFDRIIDESNPFLLVIAGRGVGKTHGAIAKMYRDESNFIYARTNDKQAEYARTSIFSPLVVVGEKEGYEVALETVDAVGNISVDGEPRGHVLALSTVQNLRGFEAPKTRYIIWDEFIRQRTERRVIKDEYDAMKNMYETINRNRELEGNDPIKMIMLGNWNIANSDILRGMDAFPLIDESARKGGVMVHRGVISLIALQQSPISQKKGKTALYQLPDIDEDFSRMAIENNSPLLIRPKHVPLNEYLPVLIWEKRLKIYRHKSRITFHATDVIKGDAPMLCAANRKLLSPEERQVIGAIAVALTRGQVTVESIKAAAELHALIGIDA